jgi:hypothetical protein
MVLQVLLFETPNITSITFAEGNACMNEHITSYYMRIQVLKFFTGAAPYPFEASAAVTPRQERIPDKGVRGVIWIGTSEGQIIE